MSFKKAEKCQRRARIALIGPSGSGKTYSALRIARGLAGGQPIALIDTEHHSASLYADEFAFDTAALEQFGPQDYIRAINEASGIYAVLIIDSLSHAWNGKGGVLEIVDKAAARSKTGNSFGAWREATPEHNALVEALVRAPMHVIVTMRAKTEYVIEQNDRGKQVPRKVGLAPVQRDGLEYEFDVVGEIDADHRLIVSKTRCRQFDGAVIEKAGEEFGASVLAWLQDGAPAKSRSDQRAKIAELCAGDKNRFLGVAKDVTGRDVTATADLTESEADTLIDRLEHDQTPRDAA